MVNAPHQIPVWNAKKPRLHASLTWSAGVAHLSVRFAEVPQFEKLQVWFDDHPVEGRWRVTALKAATENLAQKFLSVWYASMTDQWYLMVYPVKAGLHLQARQLLEVQGFPAVEAWMKADRPEPWFLADQHFHCIWQPGSDMLELKCG